jgi:nucleotide-binding universal stress UspA family protein
MREFSKTNGLEGNPAVTYEVVQGTPYNAILTVAKDGDFDLVVMGTHGRTGISHVLLGSVAEKVVRHARCPVLTIRAVAADLPAKEVHGSMPDARSNVS